MNEGIRNENSIREYLLGRISDEKLLADYEELLFLDEDFCSLAEVTEDDLINDFVFEKLNEKDREDFIKTLENNAERREKIAVTKAIKEKMQTQKSAAIETQPNFFDSLKAFFQKPLNAGAFIVLIAVVSVVSFLILKNKNTDELADLKTIYKLERPNESRLSEFDYAPLVVTRGAAEEREKNKIRRIEYTLFEASEQNPSAENFHALGVSYLTQKKFAEAIDALEKAVKADEKNANFQNDLGAAYLEFAESDKTQKLENLARANEAFSKSLDLSPEFLAARFNKSLVLQKLDLPQEAKASWEIYLQKDSTSNWAVEARKNLEKIASPQSLFRSNEQILQDFLTAYRNNNEASALKIHNETKGYLKDNSVIFLLTSRYLKARQNRDENEAQESLEALNYIGGFEREKHADFFVSDLAGFYKNLPAEKIEKLIEAKNIFENANDPIGKFDYANVITEFEKSRNLFQEAGDECEAAAAEIWAAQFLPDVSKFDESRRRFSALEEFAVRKNYKIFEPTVFYWRSVADFRQNRFSDSIKNAEKALQKARETENFLEIERAVEKAAETFTEIGETEKSLSLWSGNMRPDVYHKSKSQYWREKGNLADLLLRLDFPATADDVSKEEITKEMFNQADAENSSLRRRAEILTARNRLDEALQIAEKSLRLTEKRAESEQNDFSFARDFLLAGDIRRQMQNCETAIENYRKSLDYFGKISELSAGVYSVHKGKLLCLNKPEKRAEFQTELQTVLKFSEDYRHKIREDESRQAFFENEQVVFDTAIENAIENGDVRTAFEYAETSRARSLLDFVRSEKSIAKTEKDFGEVSKPLTLEEIQAHLPENIQVLQYAVLPQKLAVWFYSKGNFEYTEKRISAGELGNKISDFRNLILEKKDKKEIENQAVELAGLLIPANLEAEKTVVLIPDKNLYFLPFAALISTDGKFLIEKNPLVYGASASVFITATENAKQRENGGGETILSVGNPAFDRAENPSLNDLPDAEIEARKISEFYARKIEFTGENATRESFLDNFEKNEIIHFAGHFVINSRSPANSKLLFADEDLRVAELTRNKLSRSKLVVLSACETGIERFNKSEGAIGAARIFLALGTPLVVAGNWKIDSETTKDLMIAFHKNRREKKLSTSESLRQAQIEILNRNGKNQPYFWSAFNIFGGFTNY